MLHFCAWRTVREYLKHVITWTLARAYITSSLMNEIKTAEYRLVNTEKWSALSAF